MAITGFRQAADLVMPFGQHKGQTIDDIGCSDKGLLYLDWLRAERRCRADSHTDIDQAVAIYLDDETIAADLAKLVSGQRPPPWRNA